MGSLIPWRRTRGRQEPELTPGLTEYIKEVVKAEIARQPTRIKHLYVSHDVEIGNYLYVDGNVEVEGTIATYGVGDITAAGDLIANADVRAYTDVVSYYDVLMRDATSAIYWGNTKTTSGAWRIIKSGNDLVIQRYEGDPLAWVTKDTIAA